MGSTEVNYPTQNTDASGFFTVSVGTLAPGTYNYRAKGPKYLAKAGVVTLTGAPTTQMEIGLMTTGDASNEIEAGAEGGDGGGSGNAAAIAGGGGSAVNVVISAGGVGPACGGAFSTLLEFIVSEWPPLKT